jgi:hypothetical protein
MNNDDFEKRLRQQSLRTPPAEWRERILDSAKSATVQEAKGPADAPFTWLRALLWPSPHAWAGLAAVWVILLVMNRQSDEKVVLTANNVSSPVQQIADARRERNHLLAELIDETPSDPVDEPPKPFVPRPRSEAPRSLVCV